MTKFNIKVKKDDLYCPNCGKLLWIANLYHNTIFLLNSRGGVINNPHGTIIFLHTEKCKCGSRYKVFFDCHCWNNKITLVKNSIERL